MGRLGLCFLSLRVKAYLFWEELKVRRCFYGSPLFYLMDRCLKRSYRGLNPYRLSNQFLAFQGTKERDVYGETPLTTLDQIGKRSGLTPQDHLIELGCGTGRGAFFFRALFGCTITGIDWIPVFIEKAEEIARLDPEKRTSFRCSSFFSEDLSQATVIYLYGTCLKDEEIRTLANRFAQLPVSTRIITVSFPLSDYNSEFKTSHSWTASFPWGWGEIYLNHRDREIKEDPCLQLGGSQSLKTDHDSSL